MIHHPFRLQSKEIILNKQLFMLEFINPYQISVQIGILLEN